MLVTLLGACRETKPDAAPIAPSAETTPAVRLEIVLSGNDPPATGIVGALVEVGAFDLYDVMPRVAGSTVAPSLALAHDPDAVAYQARLDVRLDGERIAVTVTTCRGEAEDCASHRIESTRDHPERAAESILLAWSAQLGHEAPEESVRAWADAPSKDAYALIVAGRAASQWYGLAPMGDRSGDRRKDAFARAVFLDPNLAVAQWMLARRRMAAGDFTGGLAALELARRADPKRTAYVADYAVAAGSDPRNAALGRATWEELERRGRLDARFALARARGQLLAGRARDAITTLDTMPERVQRTASALALRVRALEAMGLRVDPALLGAWATAAPSDPEPVRRRLRQQIALGDFAAALHSADALAQRGAQGEATRARMAAAMVGGRFDDASSAARTLHDAPTAARIDLRARLERGEAVAPSEVEATDRSTRLARAALALAANDAAEAERTLAPLLAQDPWDARALALKIRAARAQGDTPDADAALRRLATADPFAAEALR